MHLKKSIKNKVRDMNTNGEKISNINISKLKGNDGDRRSAVACFLHHFLLGFDLYQNQCVAGSISDISAPSPFVGPKKRNTGHAQRQEPTAFPLTG